METDIKLAPSILAADIAHSGEQVAQVGQAGADRIHVDVMDGYFVPNLSVGAPIVSSLRRDSHHGLRPGLIPERIFNGRIRRRQVRIRFSCTGEGNANMHARYRPKPLGIDPETVPLAVAAGANMLVVGTAGFGERGGVAAAMSRLCASVGPLETDEQ